MAKFWKEPKEKAWYSVFVDGKRIAVMEDSTKVQKEISRIKHLAGVEIKSASQEDLVKVKAFTKIPERIISKMHSLFLSAKRQRSF